MLNRPEGKQDVRRSGPGRSRDHTTGSGQRSCSNQWLWWSEGRAVTERGADHVGAAPGESKDRLTSRAALAACPSVASDLAPDREPGTERYVSGAVAADVGRHRSPVSCGAAQVQLSIAAGRLACGPL